jgi:hypothetical protein
MPEGWVDFGRLVGVAECTLQHRLAAGVSLSEEVKRAIQQAEDDLTAARMAAVGAAQSIVRANDSALRAILAIKMELGIA